MASDGPCLNQTKTEDVMSGTLDTHIDTDRVAGSNDAGLGGGLDQAEEAILASSTRIEKKRADRDSA
jgi:hypothetical protein